jgi:hypothetical protein
MLTETAHPGEFLLSEAAGHQSRENGVIDASQTLKSGHVVGRKRGAQTVAAAVAFAGNTGNGALGALTGDANAPAGDYKVVIVEPGANVGTFLVFRPDGSLDGRGVVAVAYNGSINFTLADGATDFVSGDGFTVNVSYAASGRYVEYDPAATNGAEVPAGILYEGVTTAVGETAQRAIVTRMAEILSARLTWKAGLDATQKATALAQLAALNGSVGLLIAR